MKADDNTFSTASTTGTVERRRRTLIVASIVLVVVVVVGIVLGVVLSRGGRWRVRQQCKPECGLASANATARTTVDIYSTTDAQSTANVNSNKFARGNPWCHRRTCSDNIAHDISPTASPTSSPPTVFPSSAPSTPVSRVVEGVILGVALQGGAEFQNPSSYQSKALLWLQQDGLSSSLNSSRLVQRYALASVYHATFAVATPYTDAEFGFNVVLGWNNATSWLSSIDECLWYGIDCNGNGQVTSIILVSAVVLIVTVGLHQLTGEDDRIAIGSRDRFLRRQRYSVRRSFDSI